MIEKEKEPKTEELHCLKGQTAYLLEDVIQETVTTLMEIIKLEGG
jgi:hypothetical protein